MKCPNCQSDKIRKNGHRRGKQNYHCQQCDYAARTPKASPIHRTIYKARILNRGQRKLLENVCQRTRFESAESEAFKSRLATLRCYASCERIIGVNHNTVIRWVRKSALALPNAPQLEDIAEITEIDELQTFGFAKPPAEGCRNAKRVCWSKKTKSSCGQQLTIGNQAF